MHSAREGAEESVSTAEGDVERTLSLAAASDSDAPGGPRPPTAHFMTLALGAAAGEVVSVADPTALGRAGIVLCVRERGEKGCVHPLVASLNPSNPLSTSFLYRQGLGRLLELLFDLFNPTLGEKLLEHLRRWQDPESLKGLQVRVLLFYSIGRGG
jgi:hypothetical protein